MTAHHFCRQVNEDFAQCVLFDDPGRAGAGMRRHQPGPLRIGGGTPTDRFDRGHAVGVVAIAGF